MKSVKVFAPATIANIGPGFDMFGVALHGIGDVVEASATDSFRGVRLVDVKLNPSKGSLKDMPLGEGNLVFGVADYLYKAAGSPDLGIELRLDKRMGIGTGLGSSSSSSVAAAVAANEALGRPFSRASKEMLAAVLEGEFIACGSRHADNVFPSLLGGFVFIEDVPSFKYKKFDVGQGISFVVVSPDLSLSTRDARAALKALPYDIPGLVKVTSSMIANGQRNSVDFSAIVLDGGSKDIVKDYAQGTFDVFNGLLGNDIEALGKGTLRDAIVTPVRARFIRGYGEVKKAALQAGAKGFSIAGSGTSLFAVANGEDCPEVSSAMVEAFKKLGIPAEAHTSTVNNQGACLLD